MLVMMLSAKLVLVCLSIWIDLSRISLETSFEEFTCRHCYVYSYVRYE